MSYKVKLPVFEGPFDLLVYLIEDSQMSVYDIRISEITSQFIDYVTAMRDLNVQVSSEFMVLAAELLRIKSRMMLPRRKPEFEGIVEEDPRSELVNQLLAYKKCKKASQILQGQEEKMENIFSKPQEDMTVYQENPEEILELDIASFAKAFRTFLHRKKRIEETVNRYTLLERDRKTMERKILQIRDQILRSVKAGEKGVRFQEFVKNPADKEDIIVSFLSVLQLTRDQYLTVEQNAQYGEITVRKGRKNFEKLDAEKAAREGME